MPRPLISLTAMLMTWWAMTSDPAERDRGDNPIPTAIIVGGLALAAVALVAFITGVMNGWLAKIPL